MHEFVNVRQSPQIVGEVLPYAHNRITVDASQTDRYGVPLARIDYHIGCFDLDTGALLWSLLEQAGGLATDPRTRLRRSVAVTGRDGYVAVLALAEIDPEFEGKPVLLAYRRDGQPMGGNELRLVVPGDHRGGRSVRDVVRIELR
jgi:DMSO/TMAO reductase YedYZ molybdopterin-dependent catalytic subunit